MPLIRSLKSPLLILCLVLMASPALAQIGTDRHVLLDIDGDGQLNDCPNPSHSADGTSGLAELSYCSGGSSDGKVIGSQPGRVASGTCTGGGGVVAGVTNDSTVDLDGDGTMESVYGHPQACVWNMAKSDSCEVHAGIYSKAGAECNSHCGDSSVFGSPGTCSGSSCWLASIIAMGFGPNMGTTGYGTSNNPGIVRGALLGGIQDTWDADGDKRPDSCGAGLSCPATHDDPNQTSWPAIITGDADENGVYGEATSCPAEDSSCSGDAFFGVLAGCYWSYGEFCNPAAPAHSARIDTDADGTFDTDIGGRANYRDVSYLNFRHLAFTRYGGGNGSSGGSRSFEATINLPGMPSAGGDTNGLDLDAIAVYDNAPGINTTERTWATLSNGISSTNTCTTNHEWKNSFFHWSNRRFYTNDCGGQVRCGCPVNFHDNIIEQKFTSSPPGHPYYAFYLKPFGTDSSSGRDVIYRIYNNDFYFDESRASRMWDIGSPAHTGAGVFFYGNILRSANGSMNAVVDLGMQSWTQHHAKVFDTVFVVDFNNTIDVAVGEWNNTAQSHTFNLRTNRQNAFFGSRNVGSNVWAATTEREASIFCTTSTNNPTCTVPAATGRADWFAGGTAPATAYIDYNAVYAPAESSPLKNAGTCDPDGDGTNGFDYDGDGNNDTTWIDIAGNIIDCSSAGTPLNVGAIQRNVPVGVVPPPGGVRRGESEAGN